MASNFSERLKNLRTEGNVTQKQLSTAMGLKDSRSIRAYEAGESEPSISNLLFLSEYFDVSMDYLYQ